MSKLRAYKINFFEGQQDGSFKSAKEILPIVFTLIHPRSVIDVGCGVGTWLRTCQDLGVDDILGLDGSYIPKDMLRIPVSKFLAVNISNPISISRKFDLVLSLEVAEHLPETSAETFIESLINLGSVILFSAAIPLQGGYNHINEQWQTYWSDKFLKRGYVSIDCIRPIVWTSNRVEWWYAQNCLLYATIEEIENHDKLRYAYEQTNNSQLCLVHPRNYCRFYKIKKESHISNLIKSLQRSFFK